MPAVSPDGRLLAEVSVGPFPPTTAGFYRIVYRTIDGAGPALVPVPPNPNYYPPTSVASWSPDGQILLFSASATETHSPSEWFLTDLSGRSRGIGLGGGPPPAWSPDGRQLAVAAPRTDFVDSRRQLYVESVDGTTRRQLSPARASAPTWSARNVIAFERPVARGKRIDV